MNLGAEDGVHDRVLGGLRRVDFRAEDGIDDSVLYLDRLGAENYIGVGVYHLGGFGAEDDGGDSCLGSVSRKKEV